MKSAVNRLAGLFGYTISKTTTIKTLQHGRGVQHRADEAPELPPLPMSGRHGASPIMDQYQRSELGIERTHTAMAFPTSVLKRIEQLLPPHVDASAETGCGKSTILFSNLSDNHVVFALDDRSVSDSSVSFYAEHAMTKTDCIAEVFGPTQLTLPKHHFTTPLDVALIDGPHGYPFPEMEYYYFYPHIKTGGHLIIDDVVIPTIGRLADFIADDEMFDLIEVVGGTAIFQRTDAPTFDPLADGWWLQRYNRRRVSPNRDIHLQDGPVVDAVTSLNTEKRLFG